MLPVNKIQKVFTKISKVVSAYSNVRYYSRYPPHFVEPITDLKELESAVQTKDSLEIKLTSVKAASHHATCSVFFEPDVHLFSQRLMKNGDRTLARSIVDNALTAIKKIQLKKYYSASEGSKEKIELNPRVIFRKAVENTTPVLGTKLIKRSGTWYNIPSMITPKRAKYLALKFIIDSAMEKDTKERYYNSLAQELIKASENKGKAVQKKIDLHKYCEANRAYAHYRWT